MHSYPVVSDRLIAVCIVLMWRAICNGWERITTVGLVLEPVYSASEWLSLMPNGLSALATRSSSAASDNGPTCTL